MSILDDIRQQYPQYADISDGKLAAAIRKKYYPDMAPQDFYRQAGLGHLVGLDDAPANGLGTDGQNYAASMGKSVVDNLRGLQQVGAGLASHLPLVGDRAQAAYDRLKQEQSDANAQDAPLMGTKAGVLGNISGQALQAIAGGTALKGAGLAGSIVPGGYTGAAISGGLQGAIQPLSADQSEWSRLGNAAIGAGAGLGGHGIVNGLGATYRGAKALLAPFFDKGQDQIAANTLTRMGGDAAKNAVPSQIPGVNATLAEQTGDAGIAQLQRAIFDRDPALMQQLTAQQAQNNAARLGLLQQVAGTQGQLDNAIARRDDVAQQLYQQAFQDSRSQQIARQWSAQKLADEGVQAAQDAKSLGLGSQNPQGILSGAISAADRVLQPSDRMIDLSKRPIMQRAIATAKTIAANQGRDIGDPMASLEGQHYIKLALDDALNVANQQGIGKAEQSAITSTKSAFVNELERQNPAYGAARQTYRDMSGPVNQIQLGRGLLSRVTSPQADEFGQVVDALGNPVLTPDRFGNAVKQLDSIAQNVTGQKQASAASILAPEQKGAITSLLGDLSRLKVANTTGKSLGSNTVQNLATQNLLSEIGHGIGLPAIADSGLLGRLTTPVSKVYGLFGIPDQVKEKLAQVMLNPQSAEAQAIIRRMTPAQRSAFAQYAASAGGLVGQSAGLGISQKPALQP